MERARPVAGGNLLNPFYAYAAVWVSVLASGALRWSSLYPPVPVGLFIFLGLTIVIAFVLGRWFFPTIVGPSSLVAPDKRIAMCTTALIVLGFVADFAVGGFVPLVAAILPGGNAYGDFVGIPTIHVLIVTFAIFYAIQLATHFVSEDAENRKVYLALFGVIASMFVLLASREALVLSTLGWALVTMARWRPSGWRIAAAILSVLVFAYVLGGLGNVRSGDDFFDNSQFMNLAAVSGKAPSWVPGQFVWCYMYLASPVGNLSQLVNSMVPSPSVVGTVLNLIPDAVTKRIAPSFDPTTPLVVPYFNVSTGYASAWKFGGWFGLFVTAAILFVVAMVIPRLVPDRFKMATVAVLCGILAMTFFKNTLSYSGISFALAFPLLASVVDRNQRLRTSTDRLLVRVRALSPSADS